MTAARGSIQGYSMPKITKRVIDGLRPDTAGAEVFRWDGELRGFGVRIMPIGCRLLPYSVPHATRTDAADGNRQGRHLDAGRGAEVSP